MFEDVLNQRVQELLLKDVSKTDLEIEISELITDYIAIISPTKNNNEFRVFDFVSLVQSITQQIARTLSEDECYDFGEQLNKIYRRD